MFCCVCGVDIEDGDTVIRIVAYKVKTKDYGDYDLLKTKFEDGTDERLAHIECPVYAGAPMSFIGADGNYGHD